MSQLPNLKHLQYLLALHEHQHFHRAAEACFVSQSTLSSAILKLEEQLECQLVERDNKSFIFTAHGETLVEMARNILLATGEFMSYAKFQGDATKGELRLGSIPTIAPYLMPDLVQRCQESLPDLSLYLKEDTTENLMGALANGEIDVALLALPVASHNFKSRVVGRDAFYMAASEKLVDLYHQDHSYARLPEQSIFLLSNEHCLTEHAVSACQLADPSRINHFSASSITTLVQMTAYHHGFTYLPAMAVNKGVGETEGLVVERMPESMYREIGLLWRPTSHRQVTYLKIASLIETLMKDNNSLNNN